MGAPFTPGPWEYNPCITVAPDDHPCVVDQYRLVVASTLDDGHTDEECEANARLISAAPELLEALQQFVNGVETRMIDSPADETLANITHRARTALAKARGQ